MIEGEKPTFNPTQITIHDDRLQKFVRLVLLVSSLDHLDIVAIFSDGFALPMHEAIDSNFYAVPALVAIHGVISSHNSRDLTNADFLDEIPQLPPLAGSTTTSAFAPVTHHMHVH